MNIEKIKNCNSGSYFHSLYYVSLMMFWGVRPQTHFPYKLCGFYYAILHSTVTFRNA